ncbi:response regulator [Sphingomonas sp. RT2P30]|uniref:response regulator n=1 Tax=Parasphingomonas halimpatiens TaxID=3096162 RepID=UPI002FCAD1C0
MRILLVEDEPAVREELCEFLELRGFAVCAVGDVKNAVQALQEGWRPCALLTDFNLPDGSGLDLIRTIRHSLKFGPEVAPALLMTGHTDLTEQVRLALAQEQVAMLTKPLDPAALLQMLWPATVRTSR